MGGYLYNWLPIKVYASNRRLEDPKRDWGEGMIHENEYGYGETLV